MTFSNAETSPDFEECICTRPLSIGALVLWRLEELFTRLDVTKFLFKESLLFNDANEDLSVFADILFDTCLLCFNEESRDPLLPPPYSSRILAKNIHKNNKI